MPMIIASQKAERECGEQSLKPRSSRPEEFLGKDALKICSKFKGEHPCRSVIS